MSILITIIFLLLLNGFFSLSEMAIIASNRAVLRDMLKKGNKGAAAVLKILENQGRFLSTIQVGITAVGTLMAAYGGASVAQELGALFNKIPYVDPYGEGAALILVVATLTYISVIIGELIPKRIALRNPEVISILVARPMMSISYIFAPVVKVLDRSAEIVMKFLGIAPTADDIVTESEIKAIIMEGAESGVIEKSEHEMMQRIFRLDTREAKSIMTHVSDITFIKNTDTMDEITNKVENSWHSRYPVIDEETDKVIGVVQAKELLAAALTTKTINIKNHIQEVHFISESTNCLKVLEMFKSSSIHLAVVLDDYGAIEGIVTAADIFEAVVGAIVSNYDEKDEIMITRREDGSWLVDGMTPIDEINIVIGIEEINSEGKYDTIAGFILDNLNKAPHEADKITKYDYSFEIVDMDGLRIDKIMITSLADKTG